eukprot:gnl/MRDRNA2_/MRDRNA2_100015_c0_seq1.p1 gnl/MRDRNA2_/MRDRNA2_100015_c0~~gnl/MRDRNA2_/MRDRNA2_100015_c0_seq1.p1  ORF type:complete len:518 (-),score=103.25 gnl/MRDRNA2_/MRDRNA2_100015_c0_seq1:195-1748(-)
MDQLSQGTAQAALEVVRLLGESQKVDVYDPVKSSLFENEHYELPMLIVVTVLIIILGSLAAGAGIGGGGLFVPLFAFVLGVGAKAAVPLSKATILGGALGNMMSLAFARHPDVKNQNKPLIDYEASTFMQSGELLGVVFGVLLNLILPEIIIIVFLALLLSFNSYKTLQKGVSKYKDESKKMLAKKQKDGSEGASDIKIANEQSKAASTNNVEGMSEGSTGTPDTDDKAGSNGHIEEGTGGNSCGTGSQGGESKLEHVVLGESATAKSPQLQKILDEDAAQFPVWAWSMLAPMTVYTIIYAIVKKEVVSTCQPVGYWLWYFTPVPVLGLFMYVTGRILKRKHQVKVEAGYVFHGDGEEKPDYRDLQWTDATLKRFPSIAVLAGVAAGLLGIGGGMVIGPLFIQLDMHPKVGSSSCAFMILWTAVSGVVQYAFAGKLGWQFILYGIVVGFISGQLGQRGVDRMLQKTGRPSLVVFLLGGIVLVACLAMSCTGTYKLIKGISDGEDIFAFDTYDMECHN